MAIVLTDFGNDRTLHYLISFKLFKGLVVSIPNTQAPLSNIVSLLKL